MNDVAWSKLVVLSLCGFDEKAKQAHTRSHTHDSLSLSGNTFDLLISALMLYFSPSIAALPLRI